MTKYNEYRLKAQKFDKFLASLSTHNANTFDLTISTRLRHYRNEATGEQSVFTETYKQGQGWVRDDAGGAK